MPTAVTASFPTIKFTSRVATISSGGSSYDTCITVITESVDMEKCECQATQYDSSNECESNNTAKFVGYSGWFAIAEDQQTGLFCYDENNQFVGYTVTFRYYLVAKLVWSCCKCNQTDRGYWRLYARVYSAAICDDWTPGCGQNPYPDDFSSAESSLNLWVCDGTLDGWPSLTRITSIAACGTAGLLPGNSPIVSFEYCSGNVCSVVGTYTSGSYSVTVS